jgi:hypothetical protein
MKTFQSTTAETSKRYCSDESASKKAPLFSDQVAVAVRKHRMKPLDLGRELWSLYRGPGRLIPTDFFRYDLGDPKHDWVDKQRFASEILLPRLMEVACNPKWDALTEDKWICCAFLGSQGLPCPEIVAVIDKSIRSFGNCRKLASAEDLADFLVAAPMPLFAKANTGLGSFGAFVIEGYENGLIRLHDRCAISPSTLIAEMGDRTFLLQKVVCNHPKIAPLATGLATVRTMNLVETGSVRVPFTLLKIPAGGNIADNYWRPGNMIADLDPETGIIRRIAKGTGDNLTELTHDPATGTRLVGFEVPFWKEVLALNDASARLYAEVRYNTLDIGITETGPVIIEVNTGGAFTLPQFAAGRGFLTDEVMDFFRGCGYQFRRLRSYGGFSFFGR